MKWLDAIPAADCWGLPSDWALREFSRASYGAISRFETEPFGDLFLPSGRAKRTAPLHALAERSSSWSVSAWFTQSSRFGCRLIRCSGRRRRARVAPLGCDRH